MLELAHTGLLNDRQGQWRKRQRASHRRLPLFVIPIGQDLWLQKRATRGRVALQKSGHRGDTDSSRRTAGEFSRNEIDRSMNFARSALGVRRVLASLFVATAALSRIAS